MISWFHCFGACGKAARHGREHMVELSCLPRDSQEEREKNPFEGTPPMT
jgi:hypothetical protein